jgi:hypothetical protein
MAAAHAVEGAPLTIFIEGPAVRSTDTEPLDKKLGRDRVGND